MSTNNKLFLVLWVLAVISAILVIPYALSLQSEILQNAAIPLEVIVISSIIQSIVLFGIASFLGVILAKKTGFKIPLLTAWFEHKKIDYKQTLVLSIILGIIVGLIIAVLDLFVFNQAVVLNVNLWQSFLASFYGGIAEEILMRLFLLSLVVFVLMKVLRKKVANPLVIWFSIIIISILFGLAHLPITSAVVTITPFIVARAIILNGIGGIVFGWLYWKKGLESAIIAHFFTDIILHVIIPLLIM